MRCLYRARRASRLRAVPVGFPSGARRAEDIRNNDRVVFDNRALAQTLFDRARPLLPAQLDGWQLHGFNEQLRYYRYAAGQYFKWHKDGVVTDEAGLESRLTFMMYLNEDFEGGETECRTGVVKPRTGMALVFPHKTTHQGVAITRGMKYVLRTDALYRKMDGPDE